MRRKLFSGLILSSLLGFSQKNIQDAYREFYIVVDSNTSIEPTSKSVNNEGYLELNFSVKELQNFFYKKGLILYQKAFPTAKTPLLQRTYILAFKNSKEINEGVLRKVFSNYGNVEAVIELEKGGLLYEPNDYRYNGEPLSQLDLVRAPMGWEITKGSNDVAIGIVDSEMDVYHEELESKINQYQGVSSGNTWGHGTIVATTAAGATDNGRGISSIGFNTKIVADFRTSLPYSYPSSYANMQMLLETSQKPNVKVVNGSWYVGCSPNIVDEAVVKEIWDSGVLPVFAAGNGGQCSGATSYLYPQSYGNSIVVTSVGHKDYYGTPFTGNEHISLKDEHIFYNGRLGQSQTHHHHDKVDISAPGYVITAGGGGNNYVTTTGTSLAAPIVSGAAALVFSLRPDFTPSQVKDMLKNTADDIYWIPTNTQFRGQLGTGRLNLYRALKETKCLDEASPKVDFMIKDSREDVGSEPNMNTQYMWTSSDIFVRNQNDGKLIPVHQNPVYDAINPNYIYVRVTNTGCKTSSGNDTITVNWAKAGTSLFYPEYWDGSIVNNGVVFGGLAGSAVVPVLRPGQEAIVEIPWNVPNPNDYTSINSEPWHFCLLAKVNSSEDPLTYPVTPNPNIMVRNNNNLAWKNITVINTGGGRQDLGASISIANPRPTPAVYHLELIKEDLETGKAIYEEAEVGLTMDDKLLSAWKKGGEKSLNIENTISEKRKIVKGNNVILDKIHLEPNEMVTLHVSFNFLTKQNTDKQKYRYHIIQKDSETGEIMGGETFEIKKDNRPMFEAKVDKGNNLVVEKNKPITINAVDINESAVYNWYDEQGNLIHSGKDFSVSQEITKKYKLEVVTTDGFKDYSEVEVKVTPYKFISMSPNPTNGDLLLEYDIQNASSAYFIISSLNSGVSNNYILDVSSSQKQIDLRNFVAGQYSVALVVDGKVIESKNLIKK